jgi:hypothetical protein
MLEIQWDTDKKVPIRITGKYFWTAVKDYFVNFAVLNVMFSLLRPVAFAPFNTRSDAHSLDHTLWELVEPGHLINNYLAACKSFFLLVIIPWDIYTFVSNDHKQN